MNRSLAWRSSLHLRAARALRRSARGTQAVNRWLVALTDRLIARARRQEHAANRLWAAANPTPRRQRGTSQEAP